MTDDAEPTKATKRTRKGTTADAPGRVPEENQPGHQPDVVPDKPVEAPEAYKVRDVDDTSRFDGVRLRFAFDPVLRPLSVAVGVTPRTAWVQVGDDLVVRFGPWSLSTPRDNIAGCEVTGPYNLVKVAGPPRLSFRDRGVTFATNRRAGVCVRFHEPVGALLPFGLLRHPAATITVADPDELERLLAA